MRLGDVTKQIRGVSYKKDLASSLPGDNLIPLLRGGNISSNGYLLLEDLVYVPRSIVKENQILRENDFIVVGSSGSLSSVGKVARFTLEQEYTFGAFLKVIRPESNIIPGYLESFFQSKKYRAVVSSLAAGANINNLRNEHLDNLEIDNKPLLEQELESEKFRLQRLIEQKRARQRELLSELEKSVFHQMFHSLPRTQTLKEEGVDFIAGKNLIGSANDSHINNRVIKVSAISKGTFRPHESKPLPADYTPPEDHRIHKGDLLFGRASGSLNLLGIVCFISNNYTNLYLPDKVWKLSLREDSTISPEFIYSFLKSNEGRNEIEKLASGTAGVKNISKQKLISIKIPKVNKKEIDLYNTIFNILKKFK